MKNQVIAIDGPSASGKGTIAAKVADHLAWDYLDSGALYRVTALYAQQKNIAWDDEPMLTKLANNLPVVFKGNKILLEEQDVSQLIRQEVISLGASQVAKLPQVRTALLSRQRQFAEHNNLVADGRDMGAVVFPDAVLKIFLTADAQIRAQRRALQLNISIDGPQFQQILADIIARDEADTNRAVAPLKQLADAKLLDTSKLSIEETVKKVIDWYQQI